MAEPLLDVVEKDDVEQDEWYEAPNPYATDGEKWLRLVGAGLGVAANAVSLWVLSSGIYAKYKRRKALKGKTPEEIAAMEHPLHPILKRTQEAADRINANVEALLNAQTARPQEK